jgi:hypothetical protein
VQVPTAVGVHSSVLASQERCCDVLLRTWLVQVLICEVLWTIWAVLARTWLVLSVF